MPPDDIAPGTPQEWLALADGHLAMGRAPKPAQAQWELLAFHAQQAAELAIKAVFQSHGIEFRYTHDLETLGSDLERAGVSIPERVKAAARLTRYAIHTRYPGTAPPVTAEECAQAARLADEVVTWARGVIEGAPPA